MILQKVMILRTELNISITW